MSYRLQLDNYRYTRGRGRPCARAPAGMYQRPALSALKWQSGRVRRAQQHAQHAMSARFPAAFIPNAVGTSFYLLAALAELRLCREVPGRTTTMEHRCCAGDNDEASLRSGQAGTRREPGGGTHLAPHVPRRPRACDRSGIRARHPPQRVPAPAIGPPSPKPAPGQPGAKSAGGTGRAPSPLRDRSTPALSGG